MFIVYCWIIYNPVTAVFHVAFPKTSERKRASMAKSYHINPLSNLIGQCNQWEGSCVLGANTKHYKDKSEAALVVSARTGIPYVEPKLLTRGEAKNLVANSTNPDDLMRVALSGHSTKELVKNSHVTSAILVEARTKVDFAYDWVMECELNPLYPAWAMSGAGIYAACNVFTSDEIMEFTKRDDIGDNWLDYFVFFNRDKERFATNIISNMNNSITNDSLRIFLKSHRTTFPEFIGVAAEAGRYPLDDSFRKVRRSQSGRNDVEPDPPEMFVLAIPHLNDVETLEKIEKHLRGSFAWGDARLALFHNKALSQTHRDNLREEAVAELEAAY